MIMTNDEAATILYKEWQRFLENNLDYAGISDAYTMGINALKQEPCEDCISRQAVLDVVEREEFKGDAISEIEKLSSANPQEPKISKWTRVKDKTGLLLWECTCGWQQRLYTNYCPDCGAKMEESKL